MSERTHVDYSYMERFDLQVEPDRFSANVYIKCRECGERFEGTSNMDPKLDVRAHDYMREHLTKQHPPFVLRTESGRDFAVYGAGGTP